MTPDVDQNRLRRLRRQAQGQGLVLAVSRTPVNKKPYYTVVRSHSRGAAMTTCLSLDEVEAFLAFDPAVRETLGHAQGRTEHYALEDAQIADLTTGRIIQKSPYPLAEDDES